MKQNRFIKGILNDSVGFFISMQSVLLIKSEQFYKNQMNIIDCMCLMSSVFKYILQNSENSKLKYSPLKEKGNQSPGKFYLFRF